MYIKNFGGDLERDAKPEQLLVTTIWNIITLCEQGVILRELLVYSYNRGRYSVTIHVSSICDIRGVIFCYCLYESHM